MLTVFIFVLPSPQATWKSLMGLSESQKAPESLGNGSWRQSAGVGKEPNWGGVRKLGFEF